MSYDVNLKSLPDGWIECDVLNPAPEYGPYSANPVPYLLITENGAMALAVPVYGLNQPHVFHYWKPYDKSALPRSAGRVVARRPIVIPYSIHAEIMKNPKADRSRYMKTVSGQYDMLSEHYF